jgi:membrane-associated phospholipid phosphatase
MSSALDWGIEIILWLQRLSPTLDIPFKAISFTGEEEFYLIVLPLVYWCLNRALGARLTVIAMFSAYVSGLAKLLFNQVRPFEYDARVQQQTDVLGNGFPSLHTQNAVTFWGYLARQVRRRWMGSVAVLLIVLVPLSRLYLGVHFPTDLLGGYAIGALLLLLFLWLEPRAEAWLARKGVGWQLGLAIVVPLVLLLALPSADEISVTSLGMLMGALIGFAIERRWVRFESGGAWLTMVGRYLVGVLVVLVLRFGLKAAFTGLEPEIVFRVIRYVAMGLWFAAGAPWLFVKLRLAQTS